MNDNDQKLEKRIRYAIEISIRLGFLLLLVVWCLQILLPFAGVIIWGLILAMALAPLYNSLNGRLGDKPRLTATLLVLAGLVLIILPSLIFLGSIIDGARVLEANLEADNLTIPPPTQKVADWPLIGAKAYELWSQASENLEGFIVRYRDQIDQFGRALLERIAGIGGSIILLILATIIAGIMLATKGTEQVARKFFRKLVGLQGDEFAGIITQTVQNVVKGVIGVALIQAFFIGLGFVLAGVPYAGVWTLLVLVMAILQLPVLLVIILAVFWLFSALNPLPAALWTGYLLVAGASDNVLKPMLLGKGATVPMVVIFLGVIGGFMLSGFIGLFTGAIIVSLGYKLFISWLNSGSLSDDQPPHNAQSEQIEN